MKMNKFILYAISIHSMNEYIKFQSVTATLIVDIKEDSSILFNNTDTDQNLLANK
jgi:hypothetical protein